MGRKGMMTEHRLRILLFGAVVVLAAVFLAGCRPSKVEPGDGGPSADPSLMWPRLVTIPSPGAS